MSKALATLHERQVAVVERVRERVISRARKIVSYVADAPTLTANGGAVPEEWKTRRDWKVRAQVARDANLSKRHAPVYLEMQERIVENSERLEAMRGASAPRDLAVAVMVVQQPPRQYEEIIIQAKETPR